LCGEEIINKHSVSLKHRKYCSKECQSESRRGTTLPKEWRDALSEGRKRSEKCKGPNLYNWKGGKENRNRLNKKRYYEQKTRGELDLKYLEQLLIEQNQSCFYCQKSLLDYKAIEHCNPIKKGGDNAWHNLVYSCKSCNSKKKDKYFWDFCIEINKPELMNSLVQYDAYIKSR
jgi:5-methylcytosine-specific restriction endonuclease McrA